MSCSTLLDVEELWVKGSSANECLFRASEGLPLHLSDWCIFKQNLKSKWKCTLVFSRCFFTVERFWRWVECPRALTTSASSHLNTLDLNPFSAHIAFLSFKEVEQGHREGNCRILVRTVEMHVFSVQNGAVGVGHSAFKILPPSLPAGWWVWESATFPILVESSMRGVMSDCCCCTPATNNSSTVSPRCFPLLEISLWETMMDCKDQWQKN